MMPCCCDPVLGSGSNTSTITIENVGGGVEAYIVGTMGPYELRTFIAGDGISIIQNATTIVISSTEAETTLTSAGGTETIVNDGVGPALAVKGLTAAAGIQITSSLTEIFITNSSPASSVTLTSAGGTETLVNDGTGPALANKGLTAGTGVSLASNATSVTITNSSPASSGTLSSAGGTQTLVNDGTGPAVATKGLTAGTGISLSSDATSVTITATGALKTYFSEKFDAVGTNGTVYVTVSTMDAVTGALNGETWIFWCSELVCCVLGQTTVNQIIRWEIETSAGVWGILETAISHQWGIALGPGDVSTPSMRPYQAVLSMNAPRLRVLTRMSAAVATGGIIEDAKVAGLKRE